MRRWITAIKVATILCGQTAVKGLKMEADIGEAIKTARKRARFTQADVAAKLGVSQTTIAHWERGTNVPNVATLQKISKLTQTTFAGLFGVNSIHPIHAMADMKGIKGVENISIPWDINLGCDVLLVFVVEDGMEYGTVCCFDKGGAKPIEMVPTQKYLLQGYGQEMFGGVAEAHPHKTGHYRCIDYEQKYVTEYIKVRSAHRLVATITADPERVLIKVPDK